MWRIIGQSFLVFFRNIVPFAILTLGVMFSLTSLDWRLEWLLIEPGTSLASVHLQMYPVRRLMGVIANIPVEAVIAMAVWRELTTGRLTLPESIGLVLRSFPGVMHRPFYAFVSRVFVVSLIYAVLTSPTQIVSILFATTGLREAGPELFAFVVSWILGFLFTVLMNCRLFVVIPVAAIERSGIVDTVRRGWRLTARHWPTIVGLLVFFALSQQAHRVLRIDPKPALSLAMLGVQTLARVYRAVAITVCYHHIRVANGELAAPGCR